MTMRSGNFYWQSMSKIPFATITAHEAPTYKPFANGAFISDVRLKLGLRQTDLGAILGVHTMTVSKWELGQLDPGQYRFVLMATFARAAEIDCRLGDRLKQAIAERGGVYALWMVLHTVYGAEG
jgi:DNA-binding transcriptional regulator YiaG